MIRQEAHREILFELESAARTIFQREGKTEIFDKLAKIKANVARLWMED